MLKIDAESDQYVSVIRGFLVMFYDAQLIKIQHLNILYRRLSLVMDLYSTRLMHNLAGLSVSTNQTLSVRLKWKLGRFICLTVDCPV